MGPALPLDASMVAALRSADGGSRIRFLGDLQRTAGNAHVQRLLADTAPVQRAASSTPPLTIGSSGAAVRTLQELLGAAGAAISADGKFGPKTGSAVRAFQAAAGLAPDGIVGSKTWGALRSGGVTAPPAPVSPQSTALLRVKLELALKAVQSLKGRSSSGAAGNTEPLWIPGPTVGMGADEDSEEEGSWWDTVADVASDVTGTVGDAVGGVVDTVTDAVGGVVDTVTDVVGGAVDTVTDVVGGAVDTVTDVVGGVVDTVTDVAGGVVEAVSETAAGLHEELSVLAEDLRQEYAEEISMVEDVLRGIAKGVGLDDNEVARLLGLLEKAIGGLTVGATTELASGECTDEEQDVSFTEVPFTVNAKGLGDLHNQVKKKMSGGAGHVSLAAMPSMKVVCKKPGAKAEDPKVVGAAKVTATGKVVMPTRGDVGTSSSDEAREKVGINDYFELIQTHERNHAAIYQKAFSGAAAALKGVPVEDAQDKFKKIVCEAFKAQDTLDHSEGCIQVCCTAGNEKDAEKKGASACGLSPGAAKSCP